MWMLSFAVDIIFSFISWLFIWNNLFSLFSFCYCFSHGFSDINECTSGANTCDENAECINTVGSFVCQCLTGFSGDGTTCGGMSLSSLGQTFFMQHFKNAMSYYIQIIRLLFLLCLIMHEQNRWDLHVYQTGKSEQK